jgi:hypothetical protein
MSIKSADSYQQLTMSYTARSSVGQYPQQSGLLQRVNRYTGRFVMFSVNTNIYNKKTKGLTLMELFTATGKLIKFYFDN